MPDMTSNQPSDHPPSLAVKTRHSLIHLLTRAAACEHGVAGAFLFAAATLKHDAGEGGLTEAQASAVRAWQRQLLATGAAHLRHVAQLAAVSAALGDTPTLDYASTMNYPLMAVSPSALQQLVQLERPGDIRVALAEPGTAMTLADLYATIKASLLSLPDDARFRATATPAIALGDGQVLPVADAATATAAIEAILTTANAAVCAAILTEYTAMLAEAQQAGAIFAPARDVAANPTTGAAAPTNVTITHPQTVAVATLFTQAWATWFFVLQQLVAPAASEPAALGAALDRLASGVMRPLADALTQMPVATGDLRAGPPWGDDDGTATATAPAELGARLWELALTATTLRATTTLPDTFQEVTASLQMLAVQFAAPADQEPRRATLQEMQAGVTSAITVSMHGPYLVANAARLKNYLGEALPVYPQMALCRCGNSATKPFCDGAHARGDFTGQKDPKRVPDQRDTYVGTQVTILDNRGICAHSGFCTDRLSSAFRAHEEPFVAPNGGRMDDIVRAVRACPSGALSFALRDMEARESVDQQRPPNIEISQDGPYRITGGIPLYDEHGAAVPRNSGASREHYSLCRCGHSQNKPFCSGMHWYVNFHDPVIATEAEPTLFEWVGGYPALLRVGQIFYGKYVPQDPLLVPLFAHMAPDHPERVASWLSEVFHGPKLYSEQYGSYERMLSQHIGKGLTEEQRARWVSLLCQAANDAGLPNDAEFRAALVSYLEWGSRLAVENSTPGAHPPPHMPMPHWDWVVGAVPGSRVSALVPVAEEAAAPPLPAADVALHFTQHIKPLFRAMDRQSMIWAFDLWAYADVAKHAQGILARLQQGSMPCDGAWPPERIAVFQRWLDAGTKE